MALFVPDHIRHVELGSALIILDLKTGEYSSLPAEHVSLWHCLTRQAPLAADTGGVAGDRALGDFAAAMMRCGFLSAEPAHDAVPAHQTLTRASRPTLVAAARALLHTDKTLRTRGFPHAYALARQERRLADDMLPLRQALLTPFLNAEGLMPWRRRRNDCLPRSLALYRYCRRAGINVQHVIGVRANPFQAHAWVEHRGEAVLDTAEKIAPYKPISML